jgi:hypothetical protein
MGSGEEILESETEFVHFPSVRAPDRLRCVQADSPLPRFNLADVAEAQLGPLCHLPLK